MAEVMRTGERWNPRSPAEEAVVHVAIAYGYTDVAMDMIEDVPALAATLAGLPEGSTEPDSEFNGPESDYEFDEVLGALVGDTDIEALWSPALDGVEDPDDPANAFLGMGDYRPQRWHVIFDRYRDEPDYPSALH